jgi:hypothetical protein
MSEPATSNSPNRADGFTSSMGGSICASEMDADFNWKISPASGAVSGSKRIRVRVMYPDKLFSVSLFVELVSWSLYTSINKCH